MTNNSEHNPFPNKRLDNFRPDPEILMARFPFPVHQWREGEPSRPTSVFPLNRNEFWSPKFWITISSEYKAASIEWLTWSVQQIDTDLLFCDFSQRQDWFTEAGQLNEENITEWHKTRYELAEKLRSEGRSDILEHYWPNNFELRNPPAVIIR